MFSGEIPTLLTRMSIRPSCAAAWLTAGGDLVEMGDVHLQRQRPPPHPRDRLHDVGTAVDVAEAERDIGAGMGECQGNRAAEAAGGAGHQGDLAGQVETRKVHRRCSPSGATPPCARRRPRVSFENNQRIYGRTAASGKGASQQ